MTNMWVIPDREVNVKYPGLVWHLFYNNIPPAPDYMILPCEQAIEYCAQDNPEAVMPNLSGTVMAYEIVEAYHLEELVQNRIYDLKYEQCENEEDNDVPVQ